MNTIRVGIVGAGTNTRAKHIPGLQAIDGVEIASVCNRSRASSERVAAEFSIPNVYETWQELVQGEDSDAVLIGTWPYLHAPVTVAALEAGKHVLCEARMAMDLSEARSMLEAAQSRPDLVAQVVPSPFTLGVDATVRRLIAEGYLGDLLAIEVRQGGTFVDPDAPLHWRQDVDRSGLNVLSLGIWYEAIMRWVGEATRVQAAGQVFVPMRRDLETGGMRAVHIPEHLDVTADMACGAQAHFWLSSVAGLSGPPEVRLYGSAGTLRFSEGRLSGGQRGERALQEVPIPAEEGGGWRVEEDWVTAIRGEQPVSLTTFADGVKYMAFTEAVMISLREGRSVPVPIP
jgi:predicted dehydrogenase